jgi:hypothetical protein
MAQPGDIVLQDGVWYEITSISGSYPDGLRLNSTIQSYLNDRYQGVRGEGANQVFVPFDDPNDPSPWPMSGERVKRSIDNLVATETSTTSTGTGNGNQLKDMTAIYQIFVGNPDPPAIYPPQYTDTDGNPTGIVQADMMKAFISWGKAGDYFTDADVANSSGSVVVEKGADGIDRTFIKQPDGTLDFVPDVKTSATRGEGKIEFDPITQRNIIRQPDGSIQFAPEPRQQANIQTDSSGRRYITQPDGSIQYLGREFEPGVVSQGGYNLLQQPTGALSQLAPLPEPAGIETVGGMQFIRTSTGELMPLDNVMNRMMENMVVTGDLEGAAAIHAWQTRPSNQEYFDRALAYMRSPADQLVISAIARGQGLVSPPPEETIQRIGPQPDYLTEAFNMLQDQMQMGLPEGTQTFADTLAERAEELKIEALELANETTRINNNNTEVSGQDAHNANLIANANARNEGDAFVINSNFDFQDRITLASSATGADDDDDDPIDTPVIDRGGRPGGMSQLQWDMQQAVKAYNDAMGWTGYTRGNPLSPADKLIGGANVVPFENQIAILKQNTPAPKEPEEQDISGQMPGAGTGTQGYIPLPGSLSAADTAAANVITTSPQGPGLLSVGEESEEQVAPLTLDQALAQIGSPGMVYAGQEDEDEEEEVVASDPISFDEPDAVSFVEPTAPDIYDDPSAMLTTEEALAEIGADTGLSYAGVDEPVSEPLSFDVGSYEDDWFAGGGIYDDNTAIVGESGPELAIFPNGTEIVPLDRRMKPSQARRLRRRGIRGMQEGGLVFDSPLPLGIRQLQAGRSLGAPRGQLLRTAGIALPSAQARRRMLPSEQEAFGELGRLAGIPEGEFRQELGITTPSGAPRTGSARMLPLSLRR